MDKFVKLVRGDSQTRDDDFADRLSYRYTVRMLVSLAFFVAFNQYFKTPITCWSPVHFEKGHTKFATSYCWVKNTYYLPWDEAIPQEWGPSEKKQMVTYYQWIPFILFGQAVLFYMPNLVWHGLNSRSGVDADNILAISQNFAKTDKIEYRDRNMKLLTGQIDRFLSTHQKNKKKNEKSKQSCSSRCSSSSSCCPDHKKLFGKRFGNYLVILFLFSKFCYIGNVIGQLFLLNVVLSTKFSLFGFDIVRKMAQNKNWSEESYVAFPRVTLCDFEIRGQDMVNVHKYTLQCVLPINIYNEFIYLFLWYWMVFVAIVSLMSFLLWSLRAMFKSDRKSFISNHLRSKRIKDDAMIEKFTFHYLRQDGAFLLRLISHNTDNITTNEVTVALWDHWIENAAGQEGQRWENNENSSFNLNSAVKE